MPKSQMTKSEFLHLMGYPEEWLVWDMYPDELFQKQFEMYRPGDERGAEHDRNGAFHWWLKKDLDEDRLKKLIALTFKDTDQIMAADVRRYISNRSSLSQALKALLSS